MSKPELLRGEKLLKTAINQILSHPETWDQTNWHSSCGTRHCIAGWCQILSGKPQNSDTAKVDAREALGVSCGINEMYEFAENFNREDRAGYDRDGYDRDGTKLKLFEL